VKRGFPRFKLRRSFLKSWWKEYWWKEVLLVSRSIGAVFFGVINVLVYEAPKELVVNKVLKI